MGSEWGRWSLAVTAMKEGKPIVTTMKEGKLIATAIRSENIPGGSERGITASQPGTKDLLIG